MALIVSEFCGFSHKESLKFPLAKCRNNETLVPSLSDRRILKCEILGQLAFFVKLIIDRKFGYQIPFSKTFCDSNFQLKHSNRPYYISLL